MAVQAHDEIEVLDHARRAVPADRVEVFLAEQAECARDDEGAPQPVPAESAEQEGAQVFDHLHAGEEPAGNSRVGHASIFHRAPVCDADRAPHGRDLAAEQERPREAQQRVGLDQRVRVHRDDQGEPAGVDGGVEGIGLAAVLLVEDEEARPSTGAVQGPQRLGGDRLRVGARHLVEIERVPQPLERIVLGAVVHHDDLEVAVLERQDGGDARLDGRALVVGGDEDGDRRQRVALHEPLEVFVLRQPGLLPDLGDREHEQERVEGIQHQEVEEDREVAAVNDGAHAAYSASACGERPSTSRAMSRLAWCPPTSTASSTLRPAAPKRVSASPARKRTHQSLSRSASRTTGNVAGSAIIPSERTAWARTGQTRSCASSRSAAIESPWGYFPSARATWLRTSWSRWVASAVNGSRRSGCSRRAADSTTRGSRGSSRRANSCCRWRTTAGRAFLSALA